MDFERANQINMGLRTIVIRHRALADRLLGELGLYAGQEVLLLELDARGPCSQAQLAIASGCEAPTITNSVRKLEAAGLVVRKPSPDDGRVTMVTLSSRGSDLLVQLKVVWQRLAEEAVAGLVTTPLDELTAVLEDLSSSLAQTGPRRGERGSGER